MLRKVKRVWYNLRHPIIGEVWQLHHVTDIPAPSAEMKPYYITPGRLENLIMNYRSRGYDFISLDEISKPRKNKFIAVTLDDGYADNYLEAWPVFRKLSVPFCIFVATDFVFDDAVRKKENGMTPGQLKEIASDSLCTIGGHTRSHCHLNQLSAHGQESEISESLSILGTLLGWEVKYFAYPFGDYDGNTLDIVRRLGMMSFVAWGGQVRRTRFEEMVTIPRICVK